MTMEGTDKLSVPADENFRVMEEDNYSKSNSSQEIDDINNRNVTGEKNIFLPRTFQSLLSTRCLRYLGQTYEGYFTRML